MGSAVEAQLRAHGRPHAATVVAASSHAAEVCFVEPAAQVSPGQAVVLYRGDEVVGGGGVEEAGP